MQDYELYLIENVAVAKCSPRKNSKVVAGPVSPRCSGASSSVAR